MQRQAPAVLLRRLWHHQQHHTSMAARTATSAQEASAHSASTAAARAIADIAGPSTSSVGGFSTWAGAPGQASLLGAAAHGSVLQVNLQPRFQRHLQQEQQQHQQQQRAGMFVVVNVRNNNVDAAYGKLSRHCSENGLYTELRRRDHRETNHEAAFQAKRATFNKRMGQQIRDRLKWVMKRRHL